MLKNSFTTKSELSKKENIEMFTDKIRLFLTNLEVNDSEDKQLQLYIYSKHILFR